MRTLTIILLITFSAVVAYAQQKSFTGIVVDSATFEPLPYVNVQVKNSLRGTTTDTKGNFSIQATERDTLVLTIVGYRKIEYPLFAYEPSMIRMSEQSTLLAPVIINDQRLYENPYEGLFDEQNRRRIGAKVRFYYHRTRKDKIKASNWRLESALVQTYVDVMINSNETKNELIKKYNLSEKEYYDILTQFNETHYAVMYHLTAGELVSLINRFYEAHAPRK